MNQDNKPNGVSRREFLKLSALSMGFYKDLLGLKITRREPTQQPPTPQEIERDHLDDLIEIFRNPLRTIDDTCDRIQQRMSQHLPIAHGEVMLSSKFGPNSTDPEVHKRRDTLEHAYPLLAVKLAKLVSQIQSSNLDYFMQMGKMLWQPLIAFKERADHPIDEASAYDFDVLYLEKVVEWLEPLTQSTDFKTQKKAYLPKDSQAERISAADRMSVQQAMKDARSGSFDVEWYLRAVGERPELRNEAFELAYGIAPDQYAKWNVRLPSNEDLKINKNALQTIERFLPLALVPISSSIPENLTSPRGIRAYHDFGKSAIHMGEEYKDVASTAYEATHKRWLYGPDTDIESSQGATIQQGLFIQLHELFHGYETRDPVAGEYTHLHPAELIEYCTEHAKFYTQIEKFLACPKDSDISLKSSDLNSVFFSDILPIFGQDEINTQQPETIGQLTSEIGFLKDAVSAIESQHFSPEVFQEIGLEEFFDPNRSDSMRLWDVLLRGDTRGDHLPRAIELQKYNDAFGGMLLSSATGIHSKHVEQLLIAITEFNKNDQDPQAQKDGMHVGNDGLVPYERQLAFYSLLKIKSHYQLIVYTALQRLKDFTADKNTSQFDTLTRYYNGLQDVVYGQLSHCLVGPAGQYVPTRQYRGDWSLEESQSEQMVQANERADTEFKAIRREYATLFPHDDQLPELPQKQLREHIYFTQTRIQNMRLKLLGADISPAAEHYKRRGMSWMDDQRNDYLQLYPLLLHELGDTMNVHKFTMVDSGAG